MSGSTAGTFAGGITGIHWGEAELDPREGYLTFHDGEDIPVDQMPATTPRSLPQPGNIAGSRTFDGGAPPEIRLEANTAHQPPVTEPELLMAFVFNG